MVRVATNIPAALKAEGQKLLGDVVLDRLKKSTESSLAASGNEARGIRQDRRA